MSHHYHTTDVMEAGDGVDVSAFANITGQLFFNKILEGWEDAERIGEKLVTNFPTKLDGERYDLVIGAVPHRDYRELPDERIEGMVAAGGTLADLKDMWRDRTFNPGIDRWSL
jgi:hypothetical protein